MRFKLNNETGTITDTLNNKQYQLDNYQQTEELARLYQQKTRNKITLNNEKGIITDHKLNKEFNLYNNEDLETLTLILNQVKINVCIDFDGVLNTYNGWKGEQELYQPQKGTKEFLQQLYYDYNIIIFTTRPKEKINEWLEKYELSQYIDSVTNTKIPAIAYIDDRAIKYDNNYNETIQELKKFKTHWENEQKNIII